MVTPRLFCYWARPEERWNKLEDFPDPTGKRRTIMLLFIRMLVFVELSAVNGIYEGEKYESQTQ